MSRAPGAIDSHVLVARAQARAGRVRPAYEEGALVERLEAGDAGRCQLPVGAHPDCHERATPAEGVGEVLERGRVELGEVDLGEPLAAVEGALRFAHVAEATHVFTLPIAWHACHG